MKFLFLFLIFSWSFGSFSALQEIECQNFNEDKRPVYTSNSGNLVIFARKDRQGNCTYEIQNPRNIESRRYQFKDNGFFQVSANFEDRGGSESLSRTSGTKGYFFYPSTDKLSVLVDKSNGEVKVVTVSGEEVFFNDDGIIDEEKTTDLMIKQREVNQANGAAITVASPRGLLINFGYRQGGANMDSPNKELLVEDDLGNYCRIKASKLFNYDVKCKENSNACDCKGDYFKSCTLDYETIRPEYSFRSGRLDINGVSPKFGSTREMDEYIISMCPELSTALDNIRQSTTPVVVDAPSFLKDDNYRAPGIINPVDLSTARVITNTEAPTPTPIPVVSNTISNSRAPALIDENREEALKAHFDILEKERQLQELFDSRLGLDLTQSVDEGIKVNCKEELINFFNSSDNKKDLDEYLKIQGKITLHRLAWTYLKMSEDNTDDIETSIQDLLQRRNPKLHEEFLNTRVKTRNERLLSVMSELKTESEKFQGRENYPYTLKYGDLKMVELLVASEKKLGRSYNRGVMDYISIIKNSYKTRLRKKDQNQDVAKKIVDGLLNKSKKFEKKVADFLTSKNCKYESQFLGCGEDNQQDFNLGKALSESKGIIDAVYAKQFELDSELSHNYKWGTYWLHVK